MIWEIYQQGRIAEAENAAERAEDKAARSAERIEETKRAVQHLTLACQAMWELLKERTGATEAQLAAKMQEIDQRDGRQDGRISQVPVSCPACGARSNSRRRDCVMCGAPLPKPHSFEA